MGNYPRFTAKDVPSGQVPEHVIKPLEVEVEELKAVVNYIKELMTKYGILDGKQK